MKIKEILEQLWIDCNNIPDDGTIYDPIGVLQDQASQAVKDRVKEQGLSEKRILRLCQIYLLPEVIKRESAEGLNAVGLAKAIHTEMEKRVEKL